MKKPTQKILCEQTGKHGGGTVVSSSDNVIVVVVIAIITSGNHSCNWSVGTPCSLVGKSPCYIEVNYMYMQYYISLMGECKVLSQAVSQSRPFSMFHQHQD